MMRQGPNGVSYGGHNVPQPAPADGGSRSGNTHGTGQSGIEQAAAGNANGGKNAKEMAELGVWTRQNNRGVYPGEMDVMGHQIGRRDRWMRMTGWDGDLRWPHPGFMDEEAARYRRLDAQEADQFALAHQSHRAQMAQLRQQEAEADAAALRARHGQPPWAYDPAYGRGWAPRGFELPHPDDRR